MPTIRVEDDVFEGLKKIAEPFTDTPNSVIRRLLVKDGAIQELTTKPIKSSSGNVTLDSANTRLTPQSVYEEFLLYVLANDFNGTGQKHKVSEAVFNLMKDHGYIGALEMTLVSTGESKALNTIAWARNALKDDGLISRSSARGIWELTDEGKQKAGKINLVKKLHN